VLEKSAQLVDTFRKERLPVVVIHVKLSTDSGWIKTRRDKKSIPNGIIIRILLDKYINIYYTLLLKYSPSFPLSS